MKIRRLPGHYVEEREPVDIEVGVHIVTPCAPEAGKVMRCCEAGEVGNAGDEVIEVTGVGTPTWEVSSLTVTLTRRAMLVDWQIGSEQIRSRSNVAARS